MKLKCYLSQIYCVVYLLLLFCVVNDTDQYNIGKGTSELKTRKRRQSGCTAEQFQCENGKCITIEWMCDGRVDCTDSSDESEATCNDKKPGSCKLPDLPTSGTYEIVRSRTVPRPGHYTDNLSLLKFSCYPNYLLSSVNAYVPCINGNWEVQFPKCLSICPNRESKAVDFECFLRGKSRSCDEPFIEEVEIRMKCKRHHKIVSTSTFYPNIATCKNGKWDHGILPCEPECGVLPKVKQLIIGGESASIEIHPWHVGLYKKEKNTFRHICGGTIINTITIVSAAHCVSDVQTYEVYPAENYLVAAGKNYRDLDDPKDKASIQKREVEQILVHPNYRGFTHSFGADIALIKLKEDLVLTINVGLVCIDWQSKYSESIESTATVVGWGSTEVDGDLGDPLLKKLDVPIITREECEAKVPFDFKAFILEDKYCAGHFTNKSLCTGDSGGGLITVDNHNFYTLRGVVSTSPFKDGTCDNTQIATYTKISHYLDFIHQANDWARNVPTKAPEVTVSNQQHRAGSCRLPDFPTNGRYKIVGNSTVSASGNHTYGALEFFCDPNYALSTTVSYVTCANGNWDIQFPQCLRTCPSRKSETVDFECFLGGRSRSCDEPFIEGSIIKMNCKESYKWINTTHPYPGNATCRNGKWDNDVIVCERICGILPDSKELDPWHVGLYKKERGIFKYECDGTIINPVTIVTNAVCVVSGKEVYPVDDVLIAAGIKYADLDNPKDRATIQKRQVKQIKIHPDYEGAQTNFVADIALVRLKDELVLSNNVGLACIDWTSTYPIGSAATSIAWFEIPGDSGLSLNKIDSSTRLFEECLNDTGEVHRKNISRNTFCYNVPSDECRAYRSHGSGLITVNNFNLHFLRGVVSLNPANCIGTYTKISDYLNFIKQANDWIN